MTASCCGRGRSSMRVRARSITCRLCTQTSPSGCHSGSCGQPASACSSGKSFAIDAEIHREREADRRPRREQQLLELAPDPLGGQIVERNLAAERRASTSSRVNVEARGELDGAQHAQAVVAERRADRRRAAAGGRDRARPSNGSKYSLGQRIPRDRVDGEVAPPRRLGDRHVRIAGDHEAAMAASRLRFAARQRHVDVADLVDLKALADRLDAAERFEQRAQTIAGKAEHLEVDVARLGQAQQPIANPAADNQRAAAGVADGGGDAVDDRHRHLS